jgi:hypothetical protein
MSIRTTTRKLHAAIASYRPIIFRDYWSAQNIRSKTNGGESAKIGKRGREGQHARVLKPDAMIDSL